MNMTTRVLLTAILCVTAAACSKKVKENPDTSATDSTESPTSASKSMPLWYWVPPPNGSARPPNPEVM